MLLLRRQDRGFGCVGKNIPDSRASCAKVLGSDPQCSLGNQEFRTTSTLSVPGRRVGDKEKALLGR